jgi:hypothetical protein
VMVGALRADDVRHGERADQQQELAPGKRTPVPIEGKGSGCQSGGGDVQPQGDGDQLAEMG